MITTIATGVITALCVAAIFALFKSHWLYAIFTPSYFNTPLSSGQIISLTFLNAGLLTEENITLLLRPTCKIELIGQSKSNLILQGNTLAIEKLLPKESVSALLLIEGKGFTLADVESIESKFAQGKIINYKNEATSAVQIIFGVLISILLLSAPFAVGTVVGAKMKISVWEYVSKKFEPPLQTKQLAGFKVSSKELYSQGELEGALKKSNIEIVVQEVIRTGDELNITINIKNNINKGLIAGGYLESSAGTGNLDFFDSRAGTFSLAPKETKPITFKVFLPEKPAVKIIQGMFHFTTADNDELSVRQVLEFN